MTAYRYRAKTRDGATVTGVVEAYGEFEAIEQIRKTCATVEKIAEVRKGAGSRALFEPLRLGDGVLSLVSSQFSIMLRAGIPVGRTVSIIASQTSDRLMKRILSETAEDVSAGYSLAGSLEKNGRKLPAAFIETVRAGEESGSLALCFERLGKYYSDLNKVKKKVRSATAYPIAVLLLALVAVITVMVVLIPAMSGLYADMGRELPWATRALIRASEFFTGYWQYVLVGAAAAVTAYCLAVRTPSGELFADRMKLRLPLIGRLYILNCACRFADTVSMLLASGLSVSRVIYSAAKASDNKAVGAALERASAEIENGKGFSDALRGCGYFPPMLLEMISVGEESGSLAETMETAGAYYADEAKAASDRLLGLLEPVLTVCLGLFVGFIIFAVYLPMFSMYAGMTA